VIVIEVATTEMLMRIAPRDQFMELKRAAIEALTRELKFKNESPALCREQI
jgi:hypothetical protein